MKTVLSLQIEVDDEIEIDIELLKEFIRDVYPTKTVDIELMWKEGEEN